MKGRWAWFLLCAILALVMLVCGLLIPAHLRAVDVSVISRAGRNSPDLYSRGLAFLARKEIGSATLLLQTARAQSTPDRGQLGLEIGNMAMREPGLLQWGRPEPVFDSVFVLRSNIANGSADLESATEFLVREGNRTRALEMLRSSPRSDIQELLRTRQLTNTTIFPPSASASGQAFDTAIGVCGLLLGARQLGFSDAAAVLTAEANLGRNPQRFEQMLLDLMSLGQRLNWDQLATLANAMPDPETLRILTAHVRANEGELPVIFSAVVLSGKPAQVAAYLSTHGGTGSRDLGMAMRQGAGAVVELLERNRPLNTSGAIRWLSGLAGLGALASMMAGVALEYPWAAFVLKWLAYLASGFLFASAVHFARLPFGGLESPLEVGGFHFAREGLFALGFLLVVLLLSEPFLAQESQKVEFPFKLRLPMAGSAAPALAAPTQVILMNQLSLLTLFLFFVLQALLYTACLVKLAEIRRQPIAPRIKLKLLDNEDHLFDAGLYLGFVGTIISLILVSLGVIKPSLMAAYSSTSFGILFVSIFKIFNLRPVKRRLLLEAEADADAASATVSKA